jgi:hypothetical protein
MSTRGRCLRTPVYNSFEMKTGFFRFLAACAVLVWPLAMLGQAKPDLSGVWSPEEVLSIAPRANALMLNRKATEVKRDPDANCTLSGVPRIELGPKPFKILQSADEVVILYQDFTAFRQIFTDGRALPADPQPSWLGYSVGKWDGDTLVVDTIGFNDLTWLDNAGTPHSEALHVTERFHRRDKERLDIQIAIEDPKTFSKPFTVTGHARLLPSAELTEMICLESRK